MSFLETFKTFIPDGKFYKDILHIVAIYNKKQKEEK
jgi:hypothetical protein